MQVFKAEVSGKRTVSGIVTIQMYIMYFATKEAAEAFVTAAAIQADLGFEGPVHTSVGAVEVH